MKNLKFLMSIAFSSLPFLVFADKTLIVRNYVCPNPMEIVGQSNRSQFTDRLGVRYNIVCTSDNFSTLIWKEVQIQQIQQNRVACFYQIPNEIHICTLTAQGSAKPFSASRILWSIGGSCTAAGAPNPRESCVFRGEFF